MIQLQLIEKTRQLAEKDKNVSAVFMYGSFTKDEGDRYSDIEFYFFLKSKENFSAENWVGKIHSLALYFTNEYGSEVAIFENLIRGEFHFLETREIGIINTWDGFVTFSEFEKMILVDKDGLLLETLSRIKQKNPERITLENVTWLSQSLINVLLTTSNLLKREEYAHAYQSLNAVQKYLLWLIRVESSSTKHWESPTKNLEKDIDGFWYSEYQKTTSSLNRTELKRAFQKSIELSEELFTKLNIEPKINELLTKIKEQNYI